METNLVQIHLAGEEAYRLAGEEAWRLAPESLGIAVAFACGLFPKQLLFALVLLSALLGHTTDPGCSCVLCGRGVGKGCDSCSIWFMLFVTMACGCWVMVGPVFQPHYTVAKASGMGVAGLLFSILFFSSRVSRFVVPRDDHGDVNEGVTGWTNDGVEKSGG